MKRFLIKISLFISIFCLLYIGFFYCVDRGLRSSDYVDYAEWNDIYNGDVNADLLIMGSSRAWRQVDPSILDEELGLNSYNLGIDGYHIPMQIGKFKVYETYNKTPNKMIYIVDHFSFDQREDLFNKNQFLPYVKDSLLQSYMKRYSGFGWEHYNIPFYQYSGSKEVSFAGLAEYFNLKDFNGTKYKGYQSQDILWETGFDLELKNNPKGKRAKYLPQVIREFDQFVSSIKNEGIDMTLVYAPEYFEFQKYTTNRDSIVNLYEFIANKHQIPFIDYSDHELCDSKDYFYNPTHLNRDGAEKFTSDLANRLKEQLLND